MFNKNRQPSKVEIAVARAARALASGVAERAAVELASMKKWLAEEAASNAFRAERAEQRGY